MVPKCVPGTLRVSPYLEEARDDDSVRAREQPRRDDSAKHSPANQGLAPYVSDFGAFGGVNQVVSSSGRGSGCHSS